MTSEEPIGQDNVEGNLTSHPPEWSLSLQDRQKLLMKQSHAASRPGMAMKRGTIFS